MTNANTKKFIKTAADVINLILTCYYDEAPAKAMFPYCVLSNINVQDLADGDQIFFDVDVWTDEKQLNATETLEEYCDIVRNTMSGAILSTNEFHCHINFDSQQPIRDNEHDIAHRRLSFTSRIFYH